MAGSAWHRRTSLQAPRFDDRKPDLRSGDPAGKGRPLSRAHRGFQGRYPVPMIKSSEFALEEPMHSTTSWRFPLTVAALALACLACSVVSRILEGPIPTSTPTSVPPARTPSPTPSPTSEAGTGAPVLSPKIVAQMEELEDQVVELRGLAPTGPVERALLSTEELRQHVIDDFLADYTEEEASFDVRVYSLLGLLEPDFDLWNLLLELYTEQVAGFYDDDAKKMYVVGGSAFAGTERLTYVHEYVHALQDQTYDLENGVGYSDEACDANSDLCTALSSLVEGDASLLEEKWLINLSTEQDKKDILSFFDTFTSPVFDAAPAFLQEDFYFPYVTGYEFAQQLYLKGGWSGVDGAYGELPQSSEQILHPDRYPKDRPVLLQVPDLLTSLGEGWQEIDRDVLGEWYTRLVLREHLEDEESAVQVAEGWAGDYLLAFLKQDTGEEALVWVTAWDSVGEAQEFAAAFEDYGDARFGRHDSSNDGGATWDGAGPYTILERRADQSLVLFAPDRDTALALRQGVVFPAPITADGD